jgi:hypothetical protein
MRVRVGLLTGVLALAGAVPVLAQQAGTVEIGAFGRYTKSLSGTSPSRAT